MAQNAFKTNPLSKTFGELVLHFSGGKSQLGKTRNHITTTTNPGIARFILSHIHPLGHLLIHSLIYLFMHSLLIQAFIHSLTHSFIQSSIHLSVMSHGSSFFCAPVSTAKTGNGNETMWLTVWDTVRSLCLLLLSFQITTFSLERYYFNNNSL